jgi:hypothetical protein
MGLLPCTHSARGREGKTCATRSVSRLSRRRRLLAMRGAQEATESRFWWRRMFGG